MAIFSESLHNCIEIGMYKIQAPMIFYCCSKGAKYCPDSLFHSHGSGKCPCLKGNYYIDIGRDPCFTSMIIGGRAILGG